MAVLRVRTSALTRTAGRRVVWRLPPCYDSDVLARKQAGSRNAAAAGSGLSDAAALSVAAVLSCSSCQVGTRPSVPEPLLPAARAPGAGRGPASPGGVAAPGGGGHLAAESAASPATPVVAGAAAGPAGGAAAPAVSPAGPAAMYRGDAQHTGRSPFTLPQSPPQERWRFPTAGSITAAPGIAGDGTIVVGSHDGIVYALSAQGMPRWQYRTGDRVWATPALVADGTAYIGSDDDHLYAVQLSDGAARWSVTAGMCKRSGGRSPEGARCDVEQVTVGGDGTIYIGGDAIYALRSDGKVRWRFDPAASQPASLAAAALAGPLASASAPRKVHCGSAPSLGRDGTVYAVCQEVLYALSPDGSKRWEFSAQGEFEAAPAITEDGVVYLGSDDRRLYALDALGQVRFAFLAGAPIRTAVALGRDGAAVFGCDDNALYSVRGDGSLLWSYRTADAVRSSPLVDAAGSIVFGSRDDRLYAVAADGRLKWSVLLDGDVDGTPALGPDGTIYVGADDQALHALR